MDDPLPQSIRGLDPDFVTERDLVNLAHNRLRTIVLDLQARLAAATDDAAAARTLMGMEARSHHETRMELREEVRAAEARAERLAGAIGKVCARSRLDGGGSVLVVPPTIVGVLNFWEAITELHLLSPEPRPPEGRAAGGDPPGSARASGEQRG